MARAGEDAAQGASDQYKQYATGALNNFNSTAAQTNDQISQLQGNNPFTSKTALQNQNLQTSGAMNANNTKAAQELNDTAMRTGTNTAALSRTIASNSRAGQRQMDASNASLSNENAARGAALEQSLIGDRQNLANSQAQVYGTSAGNQTQANGQLVQEDGQSQQMWGDMISGAAGAAGSVFAGKG